MPEPCLPTPANSLDSDPDEVATIEVTAGSAAALNPEAGSHDVTVDPRELEAVFRAGEHSWQRFPYYERRYGERGRRFTTSDSAWIATLATASAVDARRQLRWLGALLATRGMPRWLLEVHLEALHSELVSAVPEQRAAYDRLLRVAAMFREERLRHLDETTTAELAAAFDRRVGPSPVNGLAEAGALLVAAVADERAGMIGAVAGLLDWLADPARFSDDWIAATDETVTAARARAR